MRSHIVQQHRCYGLDTSTPIDVDTNARCPAGQYNGGTSGKILGALVPIVLTGVTSTEDISLVVHSAAFEIRRWSNRAVDACSVASVEQIDADNATCYMNILNWDGTTCGSERKNTITAKAFPDVEIGGCGVGCGPYTPSSIVANNDCTDDLVASGTTCNIVCPDGFTAVGAPVSCQAGSYIGDITCSNALTAWIEDVRNDTTAVTSPDKNLDQIQTVTGPGCGEYTAVGTTCYITCAYGYFSTGTVEVRNVEGVATWVPSANAQCVATPCGTGTAIPDEGVVTPSGNAEVQVSGFDFMNDATVEVSADPAHD